MIIHTHDPHCILLVLLTACAALAQTPAPVKKSVLPPAPEGVTIRQDVSYLAPDRAEKLDLYLPANRPKDVRSPAVVMIHGGGWIGGDKAEGRSFNICTTLAKQGYVCISINYILERGKCWPQDLYDCKNAVRWLRVNADKYQVDAEHIGVIGGSAGGHLALMVAYTNRVPRLEPASPYPGVSDKVSCVVDMYGITNLLTRQKTDERGVPTGQVLTTEALMTKPLAADLEAYKLASPVHHISESTPPTLILHGLIDSTVDYEQAKELDKTLAEHGVEHQLVLLEGVGHTFDLQGWQHKPLPQDVRSMVISFFDKHLKRK
jgi:acetyl esterase/lipase